VHASADADPKRLVTALRRAARERGGPLPSIDVADALLDERRELNAGLISVAR
jgi:glycine/D-amino acid oxidase-like deaminating enzyme